jgi:hypothetical protein
MDPEWRIFATRFGPVGFPRVQGAAALAEPSTTWPVLLTQRLYGYRRRPRSASQNFNDPLALEGIMKGAQVLATVIQIAVRTAPIA